MGASVRCKLPSRDEEGYGLTVPIVESLAEKGFKLIITVDNGVSAVQEVRRAAELGVDVVVTDHHLPGAVLPEAVAVVDPARGDDESPFKCLSGAGVAFKLRSGRQARHLREHQLRAGSAAQRRRPDGDRLHRAAAAAVRRF